MSGDPYDEKPWRAYYPPGVPVEVDVPTIPVTRLLDHAAESFPRRTALVFFGHTLTYRQLVGEVDRFAGALADLGVRRGDRVALVLPNCPQNVIAFYAVLRLGAIVVQHNPLYTEAELHHQLSDSGATVAIVFDQAYERVAAARRGTDVRQVVVTSLVDYLPRGKRLMLRLPLAKARERLAEITAEIPAGAPVIDFTELLRSSPGPARQVRIEPKAELALLQYTGGTTGRPKGAMLTHHNLVANAYQTKAWDPRMEDGADTTLAVLPLFHVYGLTLCLTTTILAGGTLVLLPKFDLDMVLAAIRRYKPTVLPGVPPMYSQILSSPKASRRRLGSVRTCLSGAMRLPPELVDAFQAATGGRLVEGYGLTESSPVAIANPLNANARAGTVGVPVPSTSARIVSERDPTQVLPVGEAGELIVRGPQVFQGYWNQIEDSGQMLMGGWLRTGDIAVMSPDGFFTIIDRKRDVILASGFSIYPSEIEEAVMQHPAVEECAVIGVPDPYRGETVKACVVAKPGMTLTEDDLRAHCARLLTGYKVPKIYELRADLPRNLLGKVLRRILREEHEQSSGSPAERAQA